MSEVVDVVGLQLRNATQILEPMDFNICIIKTKAPKDVEEVGECRVVKQVVLGKDIELTVSYF